MKLFKTIILFSALLLAFTACEKNAVPTPVNPVINPERVSFQNPVVGQFNNYEYIQYECGEDIPNDNRRNLNLSITAVSPEAIEFTESFADNTDPVVYSALRQEGVIAIKAEDRQQSNLFYFYGSDSLRLEAPTVAELTYTDCVFFDNGEKFTGDYVASVPEFELDGKTYRNQKVVSCIPTILEIDGYLFYDRNGLTASIVTSTTDFVGSQSTFTRVYLLKE